MNVLAEIVASTREQVAARRQQRPAAELARAAAKRASRGDRRSFAGALAAPGLSLIAEHKRSSPSAGTIRADARLTDVVLAYERAGAAAVSVLTEETRFGGQLADLQEARDAVALPILRKDFIVEDYQVHEALAAGADAVLLIVAALAPDDLAELHQLAGKLELDVLVEVHDAGELAVALELKAPIIGINNRDLSTLGVDTSRTFELRRRIPDEVLVVAESGFSRRSELEDLHRAGVKAVLVGEALMRAEDIETATRELTGVGSTMS
ncbi:MAG TPA: indole-3-glycerol phosphate synthase TrpC [Solirubrobacteraceae bacterium]|jgi:indole-3-glycerol phosphate synthase|nr:indole-3-glycerol phosphate synthase TrpC [Solirubrobacteraceae bacterium]